MVKRASQRVLWSRGGEAYMACRPDALSKHFVRHLRKALGMKLFEKVQTVLRILAYNRQEVDAKWNYVVCQPMG